MQKLIEDSYLNFFRENDISTKRLALCISGGVDSMVLLYSLFYYLKRKKEPMDLHIIHVNHGISSNSSHWEKFVNQVVSDLIFETNFDLNLYFKSFELNLSQRFDKVKITETLCRDERYNKINSYCQENGIEYILTAHHKNDLYENNFISIFRNRVNSFFMNPIIKNKENGLTYCKPLLSFTKQELKDYLKSINKTHIEDESNNVSDNLRNVLRNDLFKALSKISNASNYLNGMESFFQHFNFTNQFYQRIILDKILPNVSLLKYGFYQKDKEGRSFVENKEYFSLSFEYILPFLNLNDNLFLKENVDKTKPYVFSSLKKYFVHLKTPKTEFKINQIDQQFIVEVINLFYFSKKGIYLTGKMKKNLMKQLDGFILKGNFLQIVNKNDEFFGIKFEHFLQNPESLKRNNSLNNKKDLDDLEEDLSNTDYSYFNLEKSNIVFYFDKNLL